MKAIGEKFGYFFSNFTLVLITLVVHIALSFLTYTLLLLNVPADKNPAFIAYEMATGGDPYNFMTDLQPHYWLWRWILLFHVISWLIVPILAATAVDGAFRLYEQRKTEVSANLLDKMKEVIKTHSPEGLSQEEVEQFAARALQEMEKDARKEKLR